jgi:NAD(P)H-dependent flavin oxidoreductase YrpB (nitropropane dioxygenase family)
MKTRLTELLGIETPIICGGMMRVGTAELAAAVSNAGALGIMTALTLPTPELLRKEIKMHSLEGRGCDQRGKQLTLCSSMGTAPAN